MPEDKNNEIPKEISSFFGMKPQNVTWNVTSLENLNAIFQTIPTWPPSRVHESILQLRTREMWVPGKWTESQLNSKKMPFEPEP